MIDINFRDEFWAFDTLDLIGSIGGYLGKKSKNWTRLRVYRVKPWSFLRIESESDQGLINRSLVDHRRLWRWQKVLSWHNIYILGGKSYGWVGGDIWDTGLGLDFGLGSWDLVFLGMTS